MTKLTNKDIDERIQGRNISRLTNIINVKTKINWQCNICEYNWQATPNKILSAGTGCPKCAGRPILTNTEVDQRLTKQNRPIKRISDIKGTNHITEWQCTLHKEHKWTAKPKDVFSRQTGCPHCRNQFGRQVTINEIKFPSIREANTYQLLIELNLDFEMRKRYNTKTRHNCDFYIPKLNLWIEVGNIKTKKYLDNIERKRKWVLRKGENFIQCDTHTQVQKYLEKLIE